MAPMAHLTFKALLDWFSEQNASKWIIHVQATQFDPMEYAGSVEPNTGILCLNISPSATREFDMDDTSFWFKSMVRGVPVFLVIPYTAVMFAVDPTTGIPNVFPFFEDWGDMEGADEVESLPPTIDPTESKFSPELILSLNKTWVEQGFGFQLLGLETDENGETIATIIPIEPVDEDAPYSAKMIPFPNRKQEDPKLLTHDTLEKRIMDRHWTVIEGGKQKAVASMPWIDVVYREKLARREAQRLNNDRLVLGNEMKSTNPDDPEDLRFGQVFYYPCDEDGTLYDPTKPIKLDVTKCTWATKSIQRPSWMKVITGGKQ